jgi:hypothetical protein
MEAEMNRNTYNSPESHKVPGNVDTNVTPTELVIPMTDLTKVFQAWVDKTWAGRGPTVYGVSEDGENIRIRFTPKTDGPSAANTGPGGS